MGDKGETGFSAGSEVVSGSSVCNWVYFSLAECNCSPCGTDSCHPRTGQCFCKTGVTGQHCDRCEVRALCVLGQCLSLVEGRGVAPVWRPQAREQSGAGSRVVKAGFV